MTMPERHLRLPAVLFLLFAFLGGAALAAENSMGGPAASLPADLSPEQAEMARKYLESNPEARKALEAARQRKEQEARDEGKRGTRENRGTRIPKGRRRTLPPGRKAPPRPRKRAGSPPLPATTGGIPPTSPAFSGPASRTRRRGSSSISATSCSLHATATP